VISDSPPHDQDRRRALTGPLRDGLSELGLNPSSEELTGLADLALLLEWWATRVNLTGHRSADAIVRRLILDAAALVVNLPDFASLNDLGSGAGFPGLPIAILRPNVQVLLVESRARRQHFQRVVVRELGLAGVSTLRGRIEEVAPRPADVSIAQAVARPEDVVEWMIGWANEGGWLAIPGGETPPRIPPHGRLRDVRVVDYRVPLGGPDRTLWLAQRVVAPS
jgi:16S rRNA (guanine527-N7)-methyltransferase